MLSDRVFEADVAVVPGENTVTVEAWDSAGNKKTDLFTLTQPAGSASFQYDANGNLTQKLEGSDTWNYEWDAENQLERVLKNGAEVARFLYDPLGRRVQKIAGGVSHEYVYDGQDILRESRSDGIVYTYAHGPGIDEPLARVSNTGPTVYYHADGLGSIVATTDSGGTVTSRRQYDAWGNLELGADQPGYAFTGREWDPETGLYYYRARYYDPKIGRFLSEDPIGLAGGVNRYEYVGGNPVGRVDPSGLDWINVTVISVIRPNDPQAGIKTMQSLTVDTETGQVVGREFNLIGKTRVPFLGERQGDGGFNRSVSGGNGCVDIRMGGRAKPFVFDMLGLPLEIDYQIGLRYDEKTGRAEVYGITDSYPSYEIYLNGQKVYDRQQTGWLGGLYGSANDNYFRFSVP